MHDLAVDGDVGLPLQGKRIKEAAIQLPANSQPKHGLGLNSRGVGQAGGRGAGGGGRGGGPIGGYIGVPFWVPRNWAAWLDLQACKQQLPEYPCIFTPKQAVRLQSFQDWRKEATKGHQQCLVMFAVVLGERLVAFKVVWACLLQTKNGVVVGCGCSICPSLEGSASLKPKLAAKQSFDSRP